jgi:c-di-GMP-binding flagellar brake protein YcgR
MNILGTKLGTKLELELVNSLGQKIGQTYISQLIDIFDEKSIAISAPIHESRLMLINNGTKIRIIFLHHKLGLVCFCGTVTNKEKTENLVLFNIKIDTELEKIQRRNYFRLDSLLNAEYFVISTEAVEDGSQTDLSAAPLDKEYKKAIAKNLSGSGACIVVGEDIPKGALIEAKIYFTKDSSIKAKFKVIRNKPIEANREKKYELGLHTAQISVKDQDAVIKYIFDQQRVKLKKQSF